jgi:hypothetical protein
MKIEEDNLKKIYQAYVASKMPDNPKKCPSPKALLKTIKCSGSSKNKRELIDHISKCSCCKDEFCILLKLHNYDTSVNKNIDVTSIRSFSLLSLVHSLSPRPIMQYVSILISVSLIISSLFLIQTKESSLGALRRNSQIILLKNPTDVHVLPNPLIFKWEGIAEAQYYILELFDETLLPLWTSHKIIGLKSQLPEDILANMKKNKYYFWMISAFSTTEKVAESDLASFFTLNK